jgi:formamidopyrimidine-DNA glycosylase
MPELPEVEVIVQELQRKIVGEVIADIHVYWEKTWIGNMHSGIENTVVTHISRKGKYILFHLTNGYLIAHLRMTGQFIVTHRPATNKKHLRLKMSFKSGKKLLFYDARKFGRIHYTVVPERYLSRIGMDALDTRFTRAYLQEMVRNHQIGLKKFLLDQRYIAGLGNIYCDESLFKARLHPERKTDSLNEDEILALHHAITSVLNRAIDQLGTTISDYRTTGGGFGTFQYNLNVYGRTNEPCVNCNAPIQKIRINNRGTHFCPDCQMLGNA